MPDPRDIQVYELLLRIVCAIVDHAEEVKVVLGLTDNGTVLLSGVTRMTRAR
jgi:hypothetical protein